MDETLPRPNPSLPDRFASEGPVRIGTITHVVIAGDIFKVTADGLAGPVDSFEPKP